MNTKTISISVLVVVIIIMGIWFYMVSAPAPQMMPANSTGDIPAMQQPAPEAPHAPESGVQSSAPASSQGATKEFTVSGQNFSFSPSDLTVNKGDTVKITFKNSGGTHDFRIDEFNVATERLSSGAEETVTFVADKTGTFEYYCSVGTHRAMGMKGTLTVE